MNSDYPKTPELKDPLEEELKLSSMEINPDHMICKQCYWIGRPKIEQRGSWPSFLLKAIFITPFTLTIKLLQASLAYMPVTKLFFKESLDEELVIFPEAPYSLYGCGSCNHPNSMVQISSHEGQDALYWAIKKEKEKSDILDSL